MCGLWTKIWMEKFRLCPHLTFPLVVLQFGKATYPQYSGQSHFLNSALRTNTSALKAEEACWCRKNVREVCLMEVELWYILFSENATHPHWNVIPSSPSSLSSSHHTPIPPYASLLFSVSSLWIQLVPPMGARLWTEWETTLECWKPTSGCSLQESPSGWFLLLQWSKHQQCAREVMYFLIHEEKLWPVGKGGELIVVYAGPCSQAFLISRVSSLTSYFLCIIETSSQITLLFPFLNDIISFSSQGPIFLVKAEFLHLACLSLLIFFFLKNFFTLTPNNPFLNCLKFKEPCRSC